jgi:hypothetical protein
MLKNQGEPRKRQTAKSQENLRTFSGLLAELDSTLLA